MGVERRAFDVVAVGSTDAQERARKLARSEGLKVRTVARVDQLEAAQRDARRESLRWRVTLAVVVP